MMWYNGKADMAECGGGAGIFHGGVINSRHVITFEGESLGEAEKAFSESVDDYLAWCREDGKEPDKPHSGA